MDKPNYQLHFELLLGLMAQQIHSVVGIQIRPNEAWKVDVNALAAKLLRHTTAIHSLMAGTTFECKNVGEVHYIDHASVTVLVRAAMETFLVFHFLACDPDETVREFRALAWAMCGLMDRQRMTVYAQSTVAKQNHERLQIDEASAQLQLNPHFQALDSGQKKKLLKGDWSYGTSWPDLATLAGYEESYFKKVYNHLCGYAHSSYISAIQTREAKQLEDQLSLAEAMAGICVKIMAEFVRAYPKFMPKAQAVLDKNPDDLKVISVWHFTAEDMLKTQAAMQANL